MRQPLNLKHNLEEKISLQNQAHQSMLIGRVEKLLNIRITSSSMYEYDERLKAPRMILKDQSQLSVEQGEILKKLNNMIKKKIKQRNLFEEEIKRINKKTLTFPVNAKIAIYLSIIWKKCRNLKT